MFVLLGHATFFARVQMKLKATNDSQANYSFMYKY